MFWEFWIPHPLIISCVIIPQTLSPSPLPRSNDISISCLFIYYSISLFGFLLFLQLYTDYTFIILTCFIDLNEVSKLANQITLRNS